MTSSQAMAVVQQQSSASSSSDSRSLDIFTEHNILVKKSRGDARPVQMLRHTPITTHLHYATLLSKQLVYDEVATMAYTSRAVSLVEIPATAVAFPFFVRCLDLPSDVHPLLFAVKVAKIVTEFANGLECRYTVSKSDSGIVELVFSNVIVTAAQAALIVGHLTAELAADDPPTRQHEYRWHDILSPRVFTCASALTRNAHLFVPVPETAVYKTCGLCNNRPAMRRECATCAQSGLVRDTPNERPPRRRPRLGSRRSPRRRRAQPASPQPVPRRRRHLIAIVDPPVTTRFDRDDDSPPSSEQLLLTSLTLAADEAPRQLTALRALDGTPFVPGASDGSQRPAGRLWGKKKAFTPVPDALLPIVQAIVRRYDRHWARQVVTHQSCRKLSKCWLISPRGLFAHYFPACQKVHESHYASLRISSAGVWAPCPVCKLEPQKKPITTAERLALELDNGGDSSTGVDMVGAEAVVTLEDRVAASAKHRIERMGKRTRSIYGYPKIGR